MTVERRRVNTARYGFLFKGALIASIFTLFLGLSLRPASAHGLATTLQQTSGNYTVELEYGESGNPSAGTFVAYSFGLMDKKTEELQKFKSVFIRFATADDKETIANASLAPDSSNPLNAKMGVNLPRAGKYQITARWYGPKDEEIANASFDLVADPPYESNRGLASGVLWILTLIVGFALGFALSPSKKSVPQPHDV